MSGGVFVSWAAYFGLLDLKSSWLAFFGYRFTPFLLSLAAAGELVADKLPFIPSRKTLFPFAGRVFCGALNGAAIGASFYDLLGGAIAGVIGAIFGTLGGYQLRTRLTDAFGRDLPAAIAEDVVMIVVGLMGLSLVR